MEWNYKYAEIEQQQNNAQKSKKNKYLQQRRDEKKNHFKPKNEFEKKIAISQPLATSKSTRSKIIFLKNDENLTEKHLHQERRRKFV